MHSYEGLRRSHGSRVSQTIDAPIMVLDLWTLGDAFSAIGVILVFGVVFYNWVVMLALLVLILGLAPLIRRRSDPGVFLHFPYRVWRMSLPGIINPRGRRTFSA